MGNESQAKRKISHNFREHVLKILYKQPLTSYYYPCSQTNLEGKGFVIVVVVDSTNNLNSSHILVENLQKLSNFFI